MWWSVWWGVWWVCGCGCPEGSGSMQVTRYREGKCRGQGRRRPRAPFDVQKGCISPYRAFCVACQPLVSVVKHIRYVPNVSGCPSDMMWGQVQWRHTCMWKQRPGCTDATCRRSVRIRGYMMCLSLTLSFFGFGELLFICLFWSMTPSVMTIHAHTWILSQVGGFAVLLAPFTPPILRPHRVPW